MNKQTNRRDFLKTAGAAASALMLSESLVAGSGNLTPHLRRDIGGLAANDPLMVSYRSAIKAMRSLPSSDPLS